MKLDMTGAPVKFLTDQSPQIGDIYRKSGGPPGFWWVVAVRETGCTVLALDTSGEVTGAQRYNVIYFAENENRRVGRAEIPAASVEWF